MNELSEPTVIIKKSFFQTKKGKITVLSGIIAILLITLVMLNYFNILPIPQMFPQLSFLPKKQAPSSSQITPPTVETFDYDTEKAIKLLSDYAISIVKPEVLLFNPKISQGLAIDGKKSSLQHEFGFYTVVNKTIIAGNLHFIENTNTPNDIGVMIQPANIEDKVTTPDIANRLLNSYFIAPYSITKCQTKGIASYCEQFKEEKDGKRGFGALFSGQNKVIFTCFIPKESQNYQKQLSCIIPPS